MIKIFCDGCGEEIKGTVENGSFKIEERSFSFVKHQKQDAVRITEYVFCIVCARKIRDFFQKIKEEK